MSADSLLAWREHFPILARCNYLISNSLGAMPRGVYDSLRFYADTWAEEGVSAWGSGWFELPQTVGNKIAPLMGAGPDTVLVHQNASIANSILLGGMDFDDPKRDKVVISELDFPSEVYALRRWLPASMRIHMIKSPDGITIDPDQLLDAIDERTRLVSVSHVLFRSAYIMPAREITAKAHRVGAQVLFNGYHSVGVIPVELEAWDVDYYIGGVLKWLCGGPGGVFHVRQAGFAAGAASAGDGLVRASASLRLRCRAAGIARGRLSLDEWHAGHRFPARGAAGRRYRGAGRRGGHPREIPCDRRR